MEFSIFFFQEWRSKWIKEINIRIESQASVNQVEYIFEYIVRRRSPPPPKYFFKDSLLKTWIDNFFLLYHNFFFYEKSISNTILDHLEAWIFKIASSSQALGDTEL